MDPAIVRELSRLDPDVPFRATSKHVHHTWAKTFYSRPELYIQPRSLEEIQKVVILARRCRRRLVTVGSGHSPSDLTCTSAWLINLDAFNRITSLSQETGLVTVQAGIRLRDLGRELDKHGLALPNLGSIDSQSIAGVVATGTHGSSSRHGLLSECIRGLSVTLANGQTVRCSATNNPSLFRAALVSLGALGIVTEITLQTTPAFRIAWQQSLHPLAEVLDQWYKDLWTSHEFVRAWWLPYTDRAILWRADKTDLPLSPPPQTFYGAWLGYHVYHNLLALCNWFPRALPWVEWFVFGMQYGFKPGNLVTEAVEDGREGLLMNCLYSQFVNEWALPLEKGPEAITRLSAWIHGDEKAARIPFSPRGVWVHCPIEVRVSDTTLSSTPRPYLDPTCHHGPTLYLNATLYRPYLRDPPCRERYYEAFEWLMRDLGGRPHWAKNFTNITSSHELHDMYGDDMDEWLKVRHTTDPDGMFIGEWHRRNLLLTTNDPAVVDEQIDAELSLGEREQSRRKFGGKGTGDGVEWIGDRRWKVSGLNFTDEERQEKALPKTPLADLIPSPPMTSTSEESFDLLAHGEASIVIQDDEKH
ncbi:putative sugar 1,4-lactone oxidase [Talaromyces proteolyticus]|uniref:D-arabinono-1,4-lactone oxidase n=1 Tax=Talaromyces proteolyticus TaxID=1131652 RepID=A0AAD4Q1L2_9EURO|nr:putative sugar 1,4-lactone oxidase [Talaromyces proteolyticus]KAH8698834.1 putative sugar 1,4-lactone oxidase [Talaromyces proteolyticus]